MIDERPPSLSAIGTAMIALELEYAELEYDIERLLKRVGLAMTKQRICLDTLKTLAMKANGGEYPPHAPSRHFAALS